MVRYAVLPAVLVITSLACAQAPFTYQGLVQVGGPSAPPRCDLIFRLFDAASGGTQIGPTLCSDNLALDEGRFTTLLDFGSVFDSRPRFLELAVRLDDSTGCGDLGGFTTLADRQRVTPAPVAHAIGDLLATPRSDAFDQQQADGAQQVSISAATELRQTFVAGVAGELAGVDVMIGSASTTRIVVNVLDGPTIIGSGTASINQILSTNFTTLSLAVRPLLNSGQTYTIQLLVSSGPGVQVLKSAASNPYPPGTLSVGGVVQAQDLAFRTRMGSPGVLASTSSLGIGVPRPAAPLHVDAIASQRIASGGIGFVLLGNPLGTSLSFDSSALQARSAAGPSLLVLNPLGGHVGIGVSAPSARLHLGGTPGSDGVLFPDSTLQTTAYRRIKVTQVFDPPALASGAGTTLNFTVAGAEVGDVAIFAPRTGFAVGLIIGRVTVGTNSVSVVFFNASASSIDASSNTADIILFK